MLEAKTEYKLLSNRKRGGEVYKNHPKQKFCTNYFGITVDPTKSNVYQFCFKLPEEVPQDSLHYQRAIKKIIPKLHEDIGYLCHKEQMIWGTKPLKGSKQILCKFEHGGMKYEFQALLCPNRELKLTQMNVEETRDQLLQILNIALKSSLADSKWSQFGKNGQFFPKKFQHQKNADFLKMGLIVQQGFKFTLVPLDFGISLQIDVCSSILQSKTFLQILSKTQEPQKYNNTIVYTRYGPRRRTFNIVEIDYNLNPLCKFYNSKKGVEMTYQQYYRECYGIKVCDLTQPLIKTISKINQVVVNGKTERVPQYIYLIPEFVSPTGITLDQRNNNSTMKALSPYTKLTPQERLNGSKNIINAINSANGLISVKDQHIVEGIVLEKPKIEYKNIVIPNVDGLIKNRGPLKDPKIMEDWILMYSPSEIKEHQIDNVINVLKKAADGFGITMKDPTQICVEGTNTLEAWKGLLKSDIEEYGKPQIIVFLLSSKEEKYYGSLKNQMTNIHQIPSQFIRKRTLISHKNTMSAASKIVIQMNIKVGATPWVVTKSHPYFKGKNIMYGGLSISKGSKGYTLAFVGTISNDCSKIYSQLKMNIARKEDLPVDVLQKMFINWAKNYFVYNKRVVPDTIILYREGLSDAQIATQIPKHQIPALEGMIAKVVQKSNINNYRPDVIIVVVNKKINSRYFSFDNSSKTNVNPSSGSVIIEPFNINNNYSFHLAAQHVTQGTCTPTLFKVAVDTSKMPKEALINFTFDQCFNYYNWQGAVRVPACLQCAGKLSNLFGEHIKTLPEVSNLMKTHFFL